MYAAHILILALDYRSPYPTPPMQNGDVMCAVEKPCRKSIPIIESMSNKNTGDFVMASPNTKHVGV